MPAIIADDLLAFEDDNHDGVIWRYMDVAKFHHLLKEESLWLCQRGRFADPYEGRSLYDEIRFYKARKNLQERESTHTADGTVSPYRQAMQKRIRQYKKDVMLRREQQFANCWYRSAGESMAMWQLYGATDGGVAVRSTLKRLRSALSVCSLPLQIVRVHYYDWKQVEWRGVEANPLLQLKHSSYDHENEVRVLLEYSSSRSLAGLSVPVVLSQLVQEVWVAPTSTKYFRRMVKEMVERLWSGESRPPVKHSHLTNISESRWDIV